MLNNARLTRYAVGNVDYTRQLHHIQLLCCRYLCSSLYNTVLYVCPFNMPMLMNGHSTCPCWWTFNMPMLMNVHSTCPCQCPFNMPMLMNVHSTCPCWWMSIQYAHINGHWTTEIQCVQLSILISHVHIIVREKLNSMKFPCSWNIAWTNKFNISVLSINMASFVEWK